MDSADPLPPPILHQRLFLAGWQCHRRLWWQAHEPGAPELQPDEVLRAHHAQAGQVHAQARRLLPQGESAAGDTLQTQAALRRHAPAILDAAFEVDGVRVELDLLEAHRRGHWLIAIHPSLDIKDEQLPGLALQLWALRRLGLRVTGAQVMHLNRACRFPELDNLLVRADVKAKVEARLPRVRVEVSTQLRRLAGALPAVTPGPQCFDPQVCPFVGRCWEPQPRYHVSTLYHLRPRAAQLEAQGYVTIDQLPDEMPLPAVAARQRQAVKTGRLVVAPGLRAALRPLQYPLTFLDFETTAPLIPTWPGCHPGELVPVQFSAHRLNADGSWQHHAWLAEDGRDPRPRLAAQVLRACRGAQHVLAYNAGFERRCLLHLAQAVPARQAELVALAERLFDLLPVVRNHVYHPDFAGSFSLKSILTPLLPELGYGDLAIASGDLASLRLWQLLIASDQVPREARSRLRSDLMRYCERDSWALLQLLQRLQTLAAHGPASPPDPPEEHDPRL